MKISTISTNYMPTIVRLYMEVEISKAWLTSSCWEEESLVGKGLSFCSQPKNTKNACMGVLKEYYSM